MDDTQRAYTNMTIKVDDFFQAHAAELAATNADVAALQTSLHSRIDVTMSHDSLATQDNTGYAVDKDNKREATAVAARYAVPFLVEYADTNNLPVLKNKINFNTSEWDTMDDNQVWKAAKLVFDQADPIMAALITAGYLQVKQDALEASIPVYIDSLGLPREMKGESSVWTKEVVKDIVKLHEILDKTDIQIDKLEFDHNELFEMYYASRGIDDAAGGSTNVFTGIVGAGETVNAVPFTYDALIVFKIEVTGANNLSFTLTKDNLDTGNTVSVAAGNLENHPITEFADNGNGMHIKNLSSGSSTYKVTKLSA